MSWFTSSKHEKLTEEFSKEKDRLYVIIDNLENQIMAKNIQIQTLTHKSNNQCANILTLKSKISELTERLKLYEDVTDECKYLMIGQRKNSAPVIKQDFSFAEKLDVLEKVREKERIKEKLKTQIGVSMKLDSGIVNSIEGESKGKSDTENSNLLNPALQNSSDRKIDNQGDKTKPKNVQGKIDEYKFNKYTPIHPDELFLKVYNFEQEIRKNDPDLYLKIKEFSLQDETEITINNIEKFTKTLSHELLKSKKYYTCLSLPENGANPLEYLSELLIDLIFEITYPKIFKTDEDYEL